MLMVVVRYGSPAKSELSYAEMLLIKPYKTDFACSLIGIHIVLVCVDINCLIGIDINCRLLKCVLSDWHTYMLVFVTFSS